MNSTTTIYFLANFTTPAPTKASNGNMSLTYFHESTGRIISIVYSCFFIFLLVVHLILRYSIIESHHSYSTRIWLWTRDIYQHIMWELFSVTQIPFWAVAAGRMLNFPPHDNIIRNFALTIIVYQIARLILGVCYSIGVDHPSGCPCKWKYDESVQHVVFVFHLPGEIFHLIVSIYFYHFLYQHRIRNIPDTNGKNEWDHDVTMAIASIIMAIFNLHFISMHYIHAWDIRRNQQQQIYIQIMQQHMKRYGHIFMSQQAQFEFLLGTLPGAGAASPVYHAFRCDPLYDPKLLGMMFDMAFPIDPITRTSTFVSHSNQTIHKQMIQSGDITQPIARLRSYDIEEDQNQNNHNNNHVHVTPFGSTSPVNSYQPQQLISHFGFMYDNIPSSSHDIFNPTHDIKWCLSQFQLMLHSSTSLEQQLSIPDKDLLSFHSDAYLYCRPSYREPAHAHAHAHAHVMEIHASDTVKNESRNNISLDEIEPITTSQVHTNTKTKINSSDTIMSVNNYVETRIEFVRPNHVITIHRYLPTSRARDRSSSSSSMPYAWPTLGLAYA